VLAFRELPQTFRNSETGTRSGLAQLDIAISRLGFWIGVKGGAVASQLCRRKRLIHWIKVTAWRLLFLAANRPNNAFGVSEFPDSPRRPEYPSATPLSDDNVSRLTFVSIFDWPLPGRGTRDLYAQTKAPSFEEHESEEKTVAPGVGNL